MNVTFEEFADFIRSQPDERPVNMREATSGAECGCLLIHFGRHKNFSFDSNYKATWSALFNVRGERFDFINYEKCVDYIDQAIVNEIKSYAEAKQLLNGH